MSEIGHRERKKQRTRAAIVAAALELFDERGYQSTTVAEIAEAAGVSPATVFVYFPSKADMLFEWWDETSERFRVRLEAIAPDESLLAVIRDWCEDETELLNSSPSDGHLLRLHRRIIDSDDSLLAEERRRLLRSERDLAALLARELGEDGEDLRPAFVAAATLAALVTMVRFELLRSLDDEESLHPYQHIDCVLTFLQAGIDSLSGVSSRPLCL